MSKTKASLFAFSATAISLWAQNGVAQGSDDTQIVTANRFQQPVSSVLASTSVVTRDEIELWQAKNLVEVLRRLPGVDIAQSGGIGQSASMYVRGSEARQTLILVDGVPFAKPGITGVADFNQIPVSIIQRVEFIRGPRSSVYGADAIGGVVNVITQNPENHNELSAGMGSKGYQEYSGSVNQNVTDQTRLTVAGSYQATNGYNIQPDSTSPTDRDRDGWRNKAFWAGVEHTFNDLFSGFFRGYGYAANADYDAGFPGGTDEQQIYNHSFDTGLRFNKGDYSSQLVASDQKYKIYNYVGADGRYADSNTLDDMEQRNLQWGNAFAIGYGTVSAGLDWQRQTLSSVGQLFSGQPRDTDSYKQDNTGAYLTTQQQLGTVTLEGALRGDDNQDYGRHGTWQTAAGWEFVPGYKASLSYGTGFQAPTLGQLYGQKHFGISANPDLQPEKSKQWEAALEGLSGPVNWRVAAYRNSVTDLIDYASDPVTFQGGYFNQKAVTLKGIEVTADFDTGFLHHQITLGYLDARRDADDEVLARRARQQMKYQLGITVYEADIDVIYQYFGKRYDNNTSQYASEQRRLPSYSTVDLAVSYPVTSHLTVRGRIANLFDKDYETAYGYQTPGREYYLNGSYSF
ncbi:TonB-dependent vitamin B12 receptor BtuB [Pantoea allii]|uniref:TonB-dependent vitamin B12 receptor BtuB n=1 Tax=Pantoea allii TaxID=574096 RepID=UPI003D312529